MLTKSSEIVKKKIVRRKNHKRRKYDKGMKITVLREAKRRAMIFSMNLTQAANWIASENGWNPNTIAKYLSKNWNKIAPLDSPRKFKNGEGILGDKTIGQISYAASATKKATKLRKFGGKRSSGERDSKLTTKTEGNGL